MKKFVSLLLSICISATALIGASAVSADSSVYTVSFDVEDNARYIDTFSAPILVGDANSDGIISSKDMKLFRSHILSKETDSVRFAFDINGDGIVGAKDLSELTKIIAGRSEAPYLSNTTVMKSFDSSEKALALTVDVAGDTDAFFDLKTSSLSIENHKYAAVVIKGADKAEIGFVNAVNETVYCENVTTGGTGAYTYAVFALPANYVPKIIEFKYDSEPTSGDVAYIDSVVFAENADDAESKASELAGVRNGDIKAPFTIDLSSAASLSLFTDRNMTAILNDSGATKILAAGASDTYAVLNLESFGISADDYKYIVYTVMLPTTDTQSSPSGQLTFYAGDNVRGDGKTERSIQYSLVNDGKFHSVIIEMTDAAFWKGNVHEIKINEFASPTPGVYHYIKSLAFCSTYEEASALCVGRDENTVDYRHLFNYGIYENDTLQMSYRYYVPMDYKSNGNYPVVTALHGAGQRGIDGITNVGPGFAQMINSTSDVARESIIFSPQCPEEYGWVETNWYLGSYSIDKVEESESLKAVLAMLESLAQRYSVDRNRLYITGFSMGGYGTWDLLTRHGDLFAAGMPLCGGGDSTKADVLADIPIWAFHGTADPAVPIRASQYMYDAIVAVGSTEIRFTPLEGYVHDIWDYTYSNEEYMGWLFSKSLSDRTGK